MTRDEAKNILLLYRHGTDDAHDPPIAEALALAKSDVELAKWLQVHFARQFVLREKFRQIAAPAGLKEQIISEQAASRRKISAPPRRLTLAFAAFILFFGALAIYFLPKNPAENSLAVFQKEMAGFALRGYAMDLTTNDPVSVRNFLAQNQAPSDFILPDGLKKNTLVGCAVENWQGKKVAMICFRSGGPLEPGAQTDLWLFVADADSVKNLPAETTQEISKVNRLATATWAQSGRLYFLGTTMGAAQLRQAL